MGKKVKEDKKPPPDDVVSRVLQIIFFTLLTLYSIITPLKYHVFENIMEKGAFAPLEQMLHFP